MQTRHRLPYIVVYVENLEASERFYTRILGLRVRDFPMSTKMSTYARALSIQGTTLLLIEKKGGREYFEAEGLRGEQGPDSGSCYPSFEVASLESFHGDALNAGVVCMQPPSGDRFGRMAVYRDPDGMLFTVVQPAEQAASHGIVLSGGGSYGAFELGVLRGLATMPHLGMVGGAAPVIPNVLTGTSVGAYNAALLACGFGNGRSFDAIVEDMVRIWTRRIAGGTHNNGVYRIRGDVFHGYSFSEAVDDAKVFTHEAFTRLSYAVKPPPLVSRLLEMVDVSTFFSIVPLCELIEDTISWQALQQSPCQLQIAATDWKDGQVRLFGIGPRPSLQEEPMTHGNFRDAIRGSTAIPGIFPSVNVDCAGPDGRETRSFVDGGLLMNSPLNPAIDVGANVIHLICVNPEVASLTLSPINSTLNIFERALVTTVAGNVQSDIDRADLVNRIAGIVRRKHSDEFYRPVTIHRYHPSKEVLGGLAGILDFSYAHLQQLIANGEKIAREHDCKKAGCVLPV